MRIRNGFVSNSSSSSFIIALNYKEKCPHCGRSSANIVDLVESVYDGGDTSLYWTDPRDYLMELEEEIESLDKELRSHDGKDDNELAGYRNSHKVSDMRLYTQASIDHNLERIRKINDAVESGKRVVSFDISHHDKLLNTMLSEQIANGEVEVIIEN